MEGLQLRSLEVHCDRRGSLTEVFRDSWFGTHAVQWNLVRSDEGVLRGMHGHFRHSDYVIVLEGSTTVGLNDMRPGSLTRGAAEIVGLQGVNLQVLIIPPGVAHGFYMHSPCTHLIGVSHYWDEEDELGCQWNDPALGLRWPCDSPRLSSKDASLPSFSTFRAQFESKLAAAPPDSCR